MRLPRPSFPRRLLGTAAGVVLAAGLLLEGWAAVDRAKAGPPAGSVTSLRATAEANPSAAAYSRLSRAQARAWDAEGAARSALTASRLAPGDAALAASAESAVDAAARARLLPASRVALAAAAGSLLLLVLSRRAKRRALRRRRALLSAARGRIAMSVEGDPSLEGAATGAAAGSHAVLRPGAQGLLMDVLLSAPLGDAANRPPLVVVLSHAGSSRTVRLSPIRDWAGAAARARVQGASLATLLAAPGRWRVHVRADDAVLADGEVSVEPRRISAAA